MASVTYNGTTFIQKGYRDALLISTATNRKNATTANVAQKIGANTQAGEFLKGQMYSLLIFSAELPQVDIAVLNKNEL